MASMTRREAASTHLRSMILFGIVGGFGTVLNTAILWLLTTFAGWHYLFASAVATEAAIVSNFIGNHHLTFQDRKANGTSTWRKFLRFQGISMVTLAGTLLILWTLTTAFGAGTGNGLLIVWNLIAILAMFGANYALNHRFTWSAGSRTHANAKTAKAGRFGRTGKAFTILALALLAGAGAASADIVATSQMGYHPESNKQVVVYTIDSGATSGTFEVRRTADDSVAYSGPLTIPIDYNGLSVKCQGNLSCVVGDFTNLTVEDTYYITVDTDSDTSREFEIRADIYYYNSGVFEEFFDAQRQQDSSYHLDQRTFAGPTFRAMADGSFIMEADQASLTLIRLGHAYRRNPGLFDNGRIQYEIAVYTQYLMDLQGVEVTPGAGPNAVRMGSGMDIVNAFVPGPTALTQLSVYIPNSNTTPGGPNTVVDTVPVVSLCGADNGTAQWDACIDRAATYYKCQIDEPCINLTYVDAIGTVTSDVVSNGYGVSKGWGYEFGCYTDIPLNEEIFNAGPDPCQIFYDETERKYTVRALLGMFEGIPALHDADEDAAAAVFGRARNTYQHIKATGGSFDSNDADTAYWGTALFLLYDYTGNVTYLQEAHALNDEISSTLISDTHVHRPESPHTDGNDLYWEEYALHRNAIEDAGLTYFVGSDDPADYFRNKVYGDYNARGPVLSISRTGERVYQYDPNIQFQNSRFMLLEGLYAAKATDTFPGTVEPFIPAVADAQLSWLTGMNAVQDGVATNSTLRSYSFIFGIGTDQPTQFHSRYLLDTGYRAASSGSIIGGRGTGYQFFNGTSYVYLDGVTRIMGKEFGAMGNSYRNETPTPQWDLDKTFLFGQESIPGWINGAFDTRAETDVIFNYRDNLQTYEYTETTNEMVAIALELFAYLDAQRNDLPRHPGVLFNESALQDATVTITTTPANAEIYLNGTFAGTTLGGSLDIIAAPGTYELVVSKTSHTTNTSTITLNPGANPGIHVDLVADPIENATLTVQSTPGQAIAYIDSVYAFTTLANGTGSISLIPGTYTLLVGKDNHTTYNESITLTEAQHFTRTVILHPLNATLRITTNQVNADIKIDGDLIGSSPINVTRPAGTYMIEASKAGYVSNLTMVTLSAAQERDLHLILAAEPNSITANSTNLTGNLPEAESARFSVTLSQPAAVDWYVNGTLAQSDADGTAHEFIFTPSIFATSDLAVLPIVAMTPAGDVAWDVVVENRVNPFFQGAFGASEAVIHVFTNNGVRNFTHVNVTIQSQAGSAVTIELAAFDGGSETDWQSAYNASEGNNNLTRIVLHDLVSGATETYDLIGTERVHFRNFNGTSGGSGTSNDDSSRPRGGGGGGGGGGLPLDDEPVEPELVYVIFTEDTIATGEEQTLRLDARIDFGGQITEVTARLLYPDGETKSIELSRTQGTGTYGTWEAQIEGDMLGKHILTSVELGTADGTERVRVRDRSYYVGDGSPAPEPYGIVYVTLDASQATQGETVKIRLDATDTDGIARITALVRTSGGDEFEVPLDLTAGSNTYGTWEGSFVAQEGDTTYSIVELRMERASGESKEITVEDRSVYIARSAADGDLLTGAVIGADGTILSRIVDEPLLPSLIAFALMGLVVGGVYVRERVKERKARI